MYRTFEMFTLPLTSLQARLTDALMSYIVLLLRAKPDLHPRVFGHVMLSGLHDNISTGLLACIVPTGFLQTACKMLRHLFAGTLGHARVHVSQAADCNK